MREVNEYSDSGLLHTVHDIIPKKTWIFFNTAVRNQTLVSNTIKISTLILFYSIHCEHNLFTCWNLQNPYNKVYETRALLTYDWLTDWLMIDWFRLGSRSYGPDAPSS